ncbi:hypothetical protein DFH08DRAFT_373093 [Mycena albidolilacea]|uniref:Uncharacterized protein n=1 Tax=Mycena albidolilacea TaxID=1033008 RepID=A0AAD7F0D2_9AGAR|nr:hypothetical protein DFH08DRAFT_373093 [Mycena albidolilacea]
MRARVRLGSVSLYLGSGCYLGYIDSFSDLIFTARFEASFLSLPYIPTCVSVLNQQLGPRSRRPLFLGFCGCLWTLRLVETRHLWARHLRTHLITPPQSHTLAFLARSGRQTRRLVTRARLLRGPRLERRQPKFSRRHRSLSASRKLKILCPGTSPARRGFG